ncbi:Cobalt-zinc-cadmium resistance protein CzcA, Cation efflux system protein CusA [Klebsiella michiganensis]|uniref:Cobalt-zinc-cadmium resistance protein CzcA, Cation efflux system protein CusA n=1 Tax=Klebsiella michiganensis TaxID=1134687 RepID=A0A7H4MYU0_9ENTR|nr:Cobalt-zinc-cadmium resistance protein CzcA, Cation efflux system protein CusA [Klebsiella michiganensis]
MFRRVASVGGMVKEYQVILNPDRLRALNVTHEQVISAIQSANQEGGGSVLELGRSRIYGAHHRLPEVHRRL